MSPLAPGDLGRLLKINVALCLILFAALEMWRPYFFLTDDNFSELWPLFTEMGRQMKSGHSPFISHFIFGGHYDLTRDPTTPFWHPFYLLPALLSDTAGKFAIIEVIALILLLMTAIGFSLLCRAIVLEFNPQIPVIYLVFYTASFLFSTFILSVGSSWVQFLGNQAALPWLALGILDRRMLKGTLIVFLFSLNELFTAYSASTLYSGIYLSIFAMGMAVVRRSPGPVAAWCFGNVMAILIASPFLVHILDGFAHSNRVGGMTVGQLAENAMPYDLYPFSFFLGNWTQFISARWGNYILRSDQFPYPSVLMASAAAWCLWAVVFNFRPWRRVEILCLGLISILIVMTVRPESVTVFMHHLPFFRSARWPFREGLQLLFFFHLLLLIRPQDYGRRSAILAGFSLLMFMCPLIGSRAPSLNPLQMDRDQILSGKADAYWSRVKAILGPDALIATTINPDVWKKFHGVPYSLIGTANFPAYLKVKSISGYSPTAPTDQVPLKTPQDYWFGAFTDNQVPDLLREQPELNIISIEGLNPPRILLRRKGLVIDLSSDVQP